MVAAVAVHDRDALDLGLSDTALRNVSDPRIEDAWCAGYRRIGLPRTFARSALPVVRVHDEPRARDLAPLGHVINIAAEGNSLVGSRLDEAGDQHLGPGSTPLREAGSSDLREGIEVLL